MFVDPMWFLVTPMLTTLLATSGCSDSMRVIASPHPDNVTKIKTAYHGYFDLLDLNESPETLIDQIRDIGDGRSRLDDDRLWQSIPRPEALVDVSAAPEDELDLAILELICIGLRDRDIGSAVHMSHQTVRNRISRMYERSGLTNRTQMAWMYSNQMLARGMLANPYTPGTPPASTIS